MTFADRRDAGRKLSALLVASGSGSGPAGSGPAGSGRRDETGQRREVRPIVMGMARGGVPVAFEVARALGAPLDVVVVRKLGHRSQPELGLGAIAEEGVRLVNRELVARLGVTEGVLDAIAAEETTELDRRLRVYRRGRPPLPAAGRTAIVVDDGLATGFTARAAIEVMRRRAADRVVLAVPVGPPDTVEELREVADDVVCVETTQRFFGLSEWYDDFAQVSDEEVARLLELGAYVAFDDQSDSGDPGDSGDRRDEARP